MIPEIPKRPTLPEPVGPRITPDAVINPVRDLDWLINPTTVLKFDGALIGLAGQPGLEVVTDIAQPAPGGHLNVNPGSEVIGSVVVGATHTFARSGIASLGGGLNIVGSAGLNPALVQNVNELNRSGFGAGMTGAGRPGR